MKSINSEIKLTEHCNKCWKCKRAWTNRWLPCKTFDRLLTRNMRLLDAAIKQRIGNE